MAHYNITTRQKSGEVTLFIRVKRSTPKIDTKIDTRIKMDYDTWANIDKSEIKWQRFLRTPEGEKLQAIYSTINNFLIQERFDKKLINLAINNIIDDEASQAIEELSRLEAEKKAYEEEVIKAQKEAERNNVLHYIQRKIELMESGAALSKNGIPYKHATIAKYTTFCKIFEPFYINNPFRWDEIDKGLSERFVQYLTKRQNLYRKNSKDTDKAKGSYMDKSINNLLNAFAIFVNFAYEDGMHDNIRASHYIRNNFRKIHLTDMLTEIYLTADEVQALFDMKLVGIESKYRDIFLIGCYTGQRFSDYCKIGRSNFSKTAQGNEVLRIKQQKTGNEIVIPILNKNIYTIMERNNYDFTLSHKQNTNRELSYQSILCYMDKTIKDIMKRLSEDVPSLRTTVPSPLSLRNQLSISAGKETYEQDDQGRYLIPRYQLVGSHTARRTGVTLLYLTRKLDTYQMMSISGHSDYKTFQHYIKLTKDDFADSVIESYNQDEKNVINMY